MLLLQWRIFRYTLFSWVVVGLLYGTQNYLLYTLQGIQCSFLGTLVDQLPNFLLWGLYSPWVLYLVHKNPLVPGRRLRVLLRLHLPVALGLGLLHIGLLALSRSVFSGQTDWLSLVGYLQHFSYGWLFMQLIIYAAVAALGYAFAFYHQLQTKKSEQLRLEKSLSETRLEALKVQLQPHFLFNTLNTASMLIRKDEGTKAVEVLAKLGDLLRSVLDSRQVHLVPLREEISFLEKYLSIEALRFGDRFRYRIELTNEAEACLIPDMLLQPVVENALKHGLSGKTRDAQLTIQAYCQSEKLYIRVEDNGSGLTEHPSREGGLGLRNVADRLQAQYHQQYRFTCSNREDSSGTRVEFVLPTAFAALPVWTPTWEK